jgi:CubicO group peptidase (beta-lactamase class C family)
MYLNGGVYNGRRILEERTVERGTTPHTKWIYPPEERESRRNFYGYGWNVTDEGVYSHGGSDGTSAWVDPARGIVGIVFTQSPGGGNPLREFMTKVVASIAVP